MCERNEEKEATCATLALCNSETVEQKRLPMAKNQLRTLQRPACVVILSAIGSRIELVRKTLFNKAMTNTQ
jgi:hypothetical protein